MAGDAGVYSSNFIKKDQQQWPEYSVLLCENKRKLYSTDMDARSGECWTRLAQK